MKSYLVPATNRYASFWEDFFPLASQADWAFTPAADIEELKDGYAIHLDVPGVKKADINVELEGRILTVKGERKRETRDDSRHTTVGRSYGGFAKSFSLPEDADLSSIQAEHSDGVLSLHIRKSELTKARAIEIK